MNGSINPKLFDEVCLVSRHGVCLLDMKQVQEKARQLGLIDLAEIIASDLKDNRITNGQYYPIVSGLFGVNPKEHNHGNTSIRPS